MSKQFLEDLNGGKRGRFRKLIDRLPDEPRIAWYPSAGSDFSPIGKFHPSTIERYYKGDPSLLPSPPHLFLFTDYHPIDVDKLLAGKVPFPLKVAYMEELPRLSLPLHKEIVLLYNKKYFTNRVVYMEVEFGRKRDIISLIYAFSENESFYCYKIAPLRAKISHLHRVCYGYSLGGGGWVSGNWLFSECRNMGCELIVSSSRWVEGPGDNFVYEFCPYISRPEVDSMDDFPFLKLIYKMGGVKWFRVLYGKGEDRK